MSLITALIINNNKLGIVNFNIFRVDALVLMLVEEEECYWPSEIT